MVGTVLVVTALAFAAWSARATTPPSAQVVALAEEATMTDAGKALFYGTDPEVLDAATFAGRCPAGAVGCYSATSIVVYEPADARLHGWVVTVAAHEMLHAAYDSLSPDDRRQVDVLLAATVARLDPDDVLLAQVDASVGEYEQSRTSEQFAYVGSQLADIDPQLEQVYARFLTDRQAVVHAYTSTSSLLVSMAAQHTTEQHVLELLEAQGRTGDALGQRTVVDSLALDIATLHEQVVIP